MLSLSIESVGSAMIGANHLDSIAILLKLIFVLLKRSISLYYTDVLYGHCIRITLPLNTKKICANYGAVDRFR